MIISGIMLVGLGIGLALDQAASGVLVGLGVGMVVEAIVSKLTGKPFGSWKSEKKE